MSTWITHTLSVPEAGVGVLHSDFPLGSSKTTPLFLGVVFKASMHTAVDARTNQQLGGFPYNRTGSKRAATRRSPYGTTTTLSAGT